MATSGAVENPNSSAPSKRGDGHVASGLQFAVDLKSYAAAQIVEHQHLLRFGQPEFPRNARVANRADGRCAGAAVVSADQNYVGMSFGDARGDRAHAHFRHQLHRNARLRIHVLQIVNELREIFDGVDVVVRRRRNQADARNRMAHARDDFVDFVPGKLSAFARLCPLRNLDLQIVRIHQI